MGLITILIIFLIIMIGRARTGKFEFLTIYCGVWLISVLLMTIKQSEMIPVSGNTYIITILSIIFFGLGYIIRIGHTQKYFIARSTSENFQNSRYVHEYRGRIKMIFFLLLIIMLFYLIQAIKVHVLFAAGLSMDTIRYEYVTKGEIMTPIEQIISSWITAPVVQYLIIPLNIWMLMSNYRKKTKIIFLILSIIDIFLYMYVVLGKDNLIYYSFSLLLIPFHFNVRKKIAHSIYIVIGLIFVLVCILNFIRSDGNSLGLEFVYGYLAVSLNLFENWANVVDEQNIESLGMAFFYGPLNIATSILGKIGLEWPYFDKLSEFIGDCISTGITVFPSSGPITNVYITHNLFFYMDFGVIGVCLGNFVYGLFMASMIKKNLKKKVLNIYEKLAENILCVGALCCFIYWPFFSTPYCMSFVILKLCFKKRQIKINNI